MTGDPIDDMLKQPVRRSLDGLNEIHFGFVFLLWGAIMMALKLWGAGFPAWMSWSWLVVLIVAVFLQSMTKRLRERWVHPRIGYVKVPPPIMGKPVAAMIVGAVVSFFYVIALVKSSQFRAMLPAFLSLAFAAGSFVRWMRLRARRFLVYALLTLTSGWVAQWVVPSSIDSEFVLCSVSVIYLVGGVLALQRILRQPLATEDLT